MNIFVTNFSRSIKSHDLEALFRRFGDVEEAMIWVEREDRSHRFAIVEMPDDDEGARAVRKLNRIHFSEERLWVQQAPEAFVEMLHLCVEAPEIFRRQDDPSASSSDDFSAS
jgi:RNA recognition motif-containing protein